MTRPRTLRRSDGGGPRLREGHGCGGQGEVRGGERARRDAARPVPVHDREDYFTPDALEKEREEERRRLEKTAARADAGKLRAAIEALAGMGRVLSAMRDDYEDAKRRIARPGTDAARLRP